MNFLKKWLNFALFQGHFRLTMKLDNFIGAIHNKRKYGFTYGSFGLITLETFVKVLKNYKTLS